MSHPYVPFFLAAGMVAATAFGLHEFGQSGALKERMSAIQEDMHKKNSQVASLDSQLMQARAQSSLLAQDAQHWQEKYGQTSALYRDLNQSYGRLERDYGALADENKTLKAQASSLSQAVEKEQARRQTVEARLAEAAAPPYTVVQAREIKWAFEDSRGNAYNWQTPVETYRKLITAPEPANKLRLEKDDGSAIVVRDHTKFVDSTSFKGIVDEVYANAGGSDRQFVYELWYITSQLTTYSVDIGEDPRWALETFTEAGGDCEDLVILIASMLKASSHTKDWKIQMVYFDLQNPRVAEQVNHVALYIETPGGFRTFVESTDKSDGLGYWKGDIVGWYFDL